MALSLLSRSTQTAAQSRLPVIEFEPLLDAVEAAALLRIRNLSRVGSNRFSRPESTRIPSRIGPGFSGN